MTTTHASFYRNVDGNSPVSDLLDMLARRCPEMMRQGGGSLPREQLWSGKRPGSPDRARIRRLRIEGLTIREISERTGWSHKTCWTYSQAETFAVR